MKIVYQGDIHLRDRAPVNRVDNYWSAEFDKLQQLVNFANTNNSILLLGGDIFDVCKVSAELINETIKTLRSCKTSIVSCYGQHELMYHVFAPVKSPLYSLKLASVLSDETTEIFHGKESVWVHTASWEQVPTKPVEGKFNIFLGHVSVFKTIPFYWKGEGYTPDTLRKKYPGFDLYLCGDIHDPLVDDNVVVSGSMMRQSISEIDYRPRCYLIDTTTMSIDPLYYSIKENVFSVPEETTKGSLDLDNLVGAMKSASVGKDSFKRDCFALAKEEPVKKTIQEIFDECGD